jgi:4-hydroxy-tetrahydrodipicolinate synthase
MPALCVRLLEAVEQGRHDEAVALWTRMRPVIDCIGRAGYVAAVKVAAGQLGVPMGEPRRPLAPLSAEASRRLAAVLAEADLRPTGVGA